MLDRIKESLDLATCTVFGSTTIHFATVNYDALVSVVSGIIAIILGAGKLYEMFSGKKVSTLFRKRK